MGFDPNEPYTVVSEPQLTRGSTFGWQNGPDSDPQDNGRFAGGGSSLNNPEDYAALPPEAGVPFGYQFPVTNPATGKTVWVTHRDSGPAEWTGRGVDVAPSAMQKLGANTDDPLLVDTKRAVPAFDPAKPFNVVDDKAELGKQAIAGMLKADQAMKMLTLPMNLPAPEPDQQTKERADLSRQALENVAKTDDALGKTAVMTALKQEWRTPMKQFLDGVKGDMVVNADALGGHISDLADYTGIKQMLGHAGLTSNESFLPPQAFPFQSDSIVDRSVRALTPAPIRAVGAGVRDTLSQAATGENVAIMLGAGALGPEAVAGRLLSLGFASQMIPGMTDSIMTAMTEKDPQKRAYAIGSALAQGTFVAGAVGHGIRSTLPVERTGAPQAADLPGLNPMQAQGMARAEEGANQTASIKRMLAQRGGLPPVSDILQGPQTARFKGFAEGKDPNAPDNIMRAILARNQPLQNEALRLAELKKQAPSTAGRAIIQDRIDEINRKIASPLEVPDEGDLVADKPQPGSRPSSRPTTSDAPPGSAVQPSPTRPLPREQTPAEPAGPQDTVGISEANLNKASEDRGLAVAERKPQITRQGAIDLANKIIEKNPNRPAELINELEASPRSIEANSAEHALAAERMRQVTNDYDKAARALNQNPGDPAATDALAAAEAQYNRAVSVIKESTSRAGSNLGAIGDIFGAELDRAKMGNIVSAKVNDGKPLTSEQKAKLDKIQETVNQADQTIEAETARREFYDEVAKLKDVGLAERKGTLEAKEAAARGRMKLKRNPEGGFVSPDMLQDAITIGAGHIKRGLTNFRDWSSKMVRDLGEWVRPHLSNLWGHAKRLLAGDTLPHAQEHGGINLIGQRTKTQPQTNTKEFRNWFGKSKVVDEKGEALRVFHGTVSPGFDVFDTENPKRVTADFNAALGAHFAEKPHVASSLAMGLYSKDPSNVKGAVYPVYLRIENPLMIGEGRPPSSLISALQEKIDDATKKYDAAARARSLAVDQDALLKSLETNGIDHPETQRLLSGGDAGDLAQKLHDEMMARVRERMLVEEANRPITEAELIKRTGKTHDQIHALSTPKRLREGKRLKAALEEMGFDGVLYENAVEKEGKYTRTWIAFHPEQIKSAIGNSGKFDRLNPDIGGGIDVSGGSSRISPRFITAVKATEENGPHLKSDLAAALKYPVSFDKNAKVVGTPTDTSMGEGKKEVATGKAYGFMGDTTGMSSQDVVEKYINHLKDNLIWLHNKMPAAWRERAKEWYPGGHKIITRFADRYELTREATAGVAASLSPGQDWFNNITIAHRLIDIVKEHHSDPWSDQMAKTMELIFPGDKYQTIREEITGKNLDQVKGRLARAAWVRTFDEAYNDKSYHVVTPEGEYGDLKRNLPKKGQTQGDPTKLRWTSNDNIAKAMNILDDPRVENIQNTIGNDQKVRNFYNNLIEPESPAGDVTVDTHAVAAGHMLPLAGSSLEVDHNFGSSGASHSAHSGLGGTYPFHVEAYTRAAAELGIRPNSLQSITWEAIRGLFRPEFKRNPNNVAAARAVWERYGRGEIDVNQARDEIFKLGGGIAEPDWVKTQPGVSRAGAHEGALPSLKQADVFGTRVPTGRQAAGKLPAGGTAGGVSGPAGVGFLDRKEAAARERIKGRRGRLNIGVDPGSLVDEAIIGAAHIARGIKKLPDWKAKMKADLGDWVTPHLDAIWKESRKMAAAVAQGKRGPMSEDQRTANAIKRDVATAQALRDKVANQDTSPLRPPRRPILPNDKLLEAQAEKKRAYNEFHAMIADKEYADRPLWHRMAGHVSGLARSAVLMSGKVYGKLFSFSLGKMAEAPLAAAAGAIAEHTPGLRRIFGKADMESGNPIKALASFYSSMAGKGMREAYQVLKTGHSNETAVHGKMRAARAHWYDFFGLTHDVEKTPLFTGAMEMYRTRAYENAIKNGLDPNDEIVKGLIQQKSYDYALWDKLQEHSEFSSWVKEGMAKLEKVNKETGHADPSKVLLSTFIRTFLTKDIIKTPFNYMAQSLMQRTPIGLARGLGKAAAAHVRGIEKLSDTEANAIARLIKVGAVGSAMTALGAMDATRKPEDRIFGGYYQPGDKRKHGDVSFGTVRIGSYETHLGAHNLLLEPAMIGNTMMRVALTMRKGKPLGWLEGIAAAIMGPINNAPIVNPITRIEGFQGKHKMQQYIGDQVASLIPAISRNVAEWTDPLPHEQRRSPQNFGESLMMAVPGLREKVKPKSKSATPGEIQ